VLKKNRSTLVTFFAVPGNSKDWFLSNKKGGARLTGAPVAALCERRIRVGIGSHARRRGLYRKPTPSVFPQAHLRRRAGNFPGPREQVPVFPFDPNHGKIIDGKIIFLEKCSGGLRPSTCSGALRASGFFCNAEISQIYVNVSRFFDPISPAYPNKLSKSLCEPTQNQWISSPFLRPTARYFAEILTDQISFVPANFLKRKEG